MVILTENQILYISCMFTVFTNTIESAHQRFAIGSDAQSELHLIYLLVSTVYTLQIVH